MNRNKLHTVIAVLLLCHTGIQSKTIYISPEGNNANTGISPLSAWKTIDKLSSQLNAVIPFDSILFQRNGHYFGQVALHLLRFTDRQTYIGSYGEGELPVIHGYKNTRHWSLSLNTDSIWSSEIHLGELPAFIIINNEMHFPGRFPRDGYLKTTYKKAAGALHDEQNSYPNHYWKGSTMVIKTSKWILDKIPVSEYTNQTFRLQRAGTYSFNNVHEYYLQNHIHALPDNGDWCYDISNKQLKIRDNVGNPERCEIKVPFLKNGIVLNSCSNITIENICFKGFSESAIKVYKCKNIILNRIVIQELSGNGLDADHTSELEITDCSINSICNNAVNVRNSRGCQVSGNSIKNVAYLPGTGWSGNGSYTGLNLIDNQNITISNNTLDSIGYTGINIARSDSVFIYRNVISDYCLVKEDGGAIYTWNSKCTQAEIKNNLILGTKNTTQEAKKGNYHEIFGIYIDDKSSNYFIENNTIQENYAGIFIHNSDHLSVSGNRLYNNHINLLFVEGGSVNDYPLVHCRIENNSLMTKSWQVQVELRSGLTDARSFARFHENIYASVSSSNIFRIKSRFTNNNQYTKYSIKEWRNHSVSGIECTGETEPRYPVHNTLLVYNRTESIIQTSEYIGYKRLYDLRTIQKPVDMLPFTSFILFK